jgi:hypothetical protein
MGSHKGAVKIAVGIDAHQARARAEAGIETRESQPKVTEKLVAGLVTVECRSCGCTNAWPPDAKRSQKVCAFCGAQWKGVGWDAARDFLAGGGA